MTPVHGISPAQNDEATGYPETWKFGEHGDLVAHVRPLRRGADSRLRDEGDPRARRRRPRALDLA
jgi:hypothetical protein